MSLLAPPLAVLTDFIASSIARASPVASSKQNIPTLFMHILLAIELFYHFFIKQLATTRTMCHVPCRF
jgi:hypothetical protein